MWGLLLWLGGLPAAYAQPSVYSPLFSAHSAGHVGRVVYHSAQAQLPPHTLTASGQCLNAQAQPEYERLYGVLGTRFGGTGLANFCLPNLNGRMLLGASGSRPAGTTGGALEVVLSIAHLPSHNHGGGCHNHAVQGSTADDHNFTGNGNACGGPDAGHQNTRVTSTNYGLQTEGGNQAHPNLPPYRAVRVLIYY